MTLGMNIPILCYHSIDNSGSLISTAPSLFTKQIEYLKKHHYRVVSLSELLRVLHAREFVSPKTVVMTFDDGYKNNYTYAFPLLKSCGFSATIFLATEYVGQKAGWMKRDLEAMFRKNSRLSSGQVDLNFLNRALVQKRIPYLLTLPQKQLAAAIEKFLVLADLPIFGWKEVQEMSQDGIEFGAHSHSHAFLPELTTADASLEIRRSKEEIEKNLQTPVSSFCYPYGIFNCTVKKLVREAGFLCACSTRFGLNVINDVDLFSLKRIMMGDNIDMFKFRLCLSRYNTYLFAIKKMLNRLVFRGSSKDADEEAKPQVRRAQ